MSARLPSHPATARPFAARIFAFAAMAFLAACDLALPGAGGNSGQQIDPNAPVQVALLVPGGTGAAEASAIAASLENAARMAIADLNGVEIDLRVYNTARDPGQASQMAATAIADGAKIILGPLDAASANAVGVTVAPANVNVLAFSNNPAIAGGNVFVLGNTFGNVSDRLVSYAGTQGINQFMIVHQDDLAGAVGRDSIATSIRSAGGTVSGIEAYPFSQEGIFARAPAIAAATNASGAQAVFVTDNVAGGLPILATSLDDQGLNPANTPLVGITRWDAAPQAAALPGLQGGLFAMANAGREAAFRNRYEAAYGSAPHPLASIAYDGIAAIGALAATGDRNALTAGSLTRASGFAGATGIFRLRPDGSNQRALAVARIVNNQFRLLTQLRNLSGAADPDLTFDPNQLPAPEDLICAADDILDRSALRAAINDAIAGCGSGGGERRKAVVPFSGCDETGRDRIAEAFLASPFESVPTTQAYAWLTDAIVIEVFVLARTHLHPLPNPTEAERLALIAVGGSGRGEMAPFSDVDLLFLAPYKLTPWSESLIRSMLYILWDLKLKVGHASRTVKDCLRLAREDYTIRTSLVEERFLVGDAALATELTERLRTELFASTIPEFIEAKLAEREKSAASTGGQRYMVEPNVKEGKGGLRDLQSLYWIGKYIHGVKNASELVKFKVFTQDEYEEFKAAHEFLWAVRCHLHLLTGRSMDQLTFDMQVEVADRMHYKDRGGRRAVEHFMQDYFRFATDVGELTRIFLVAQEEALLKAEPMLLRLFNRTKKAKAPYAIKHNRLTVENPDAFLQDKLNLLRIFEEALRTGTLIHSDAMRLIKANLYLIDDEVRADKEAQRIFLDLMLKHGNPERALRRMNELGVLGAFIPEFEAIVAMMQFNMYHHYTVDEHTIQTISHLAKIERAELDEELPVSASIIKGGINRKVLYVALLLHDIGKGRDEDHSILGAKIARTVAPRLGLSKKDCETVEWLVRYHLLMSDMAQKRDIADPRTVRDFAKAVKTKERLDLLCVLTVCDIRGVGPDTWNNWKAVLIRGLYRQTRFALENGMEALNREERGTEARKNLRAALPDWSEKALRAEVARHYPPYWQGLHVTAHVDFANLLAGIGTDEVRINLTPDDDRDATRVCFAMADHPGIFSRMCGALSLAGANVVDARTFTTKDGFATAAFWVQDSDGHPYEEARLPRLRQVIERTLQGEIVPRDALADKGKLKKREKAFHVSTSITFDNEGSEIYTIIEVDTRDRLGLLHDLTRTLANANVYISSAVIATYGEQVVDTFYVKDMFGLKFHAESKRNALERKLREAIVQGVERDAD